MLSRHLDGLCTTQKTNGAALFQNQWRCFPLFGRVVVKARCMAGIVHYDRCTAVADGETVLLRENRNPTFQHKSDAGHAKTVLLALDRWILAMLAAAFVSVIRPVIIVIDGGFYTEDCIANAQSLGQARQAVLFLEKLAGTGTSGKVVDKVVTVITGQTVVTPETIEGLKSIINGEKENEDWRTILAQSVGNVWSSAFDMVSQLNPSALIESAGTSFEGFVELAAERFAAFELSTLVALGERWLLWMPFIIIPMYWQMSRSKSQNEENSRARELMLMQSEEASVKAIKVREELERIELKTRLLDLVYSLGKEAWQTSSGNDRLKRKQIDEILETLLDLNPTKSLPVLNAEAAMALGTEQFFSPQFLHTCDVDGNWVLIYVSQTNGTRQQEGQLPIFPNAELPAGIELNNLRQVVWHKGSTDPSVPSSTISALGGKMMAQNTAHLRLGPLGVIEVFVQGTWENQKDGKSALVSFDTFSAKPLEVFGNPVRQDLPALSLSIPSSLQTSGEWQTVYLDSSLRINRGRTGQLYIFKKEA